MPSVSWRWLEVSRETAVLILTRRRQPQPSSRFGYDRAQLSRLSADWPSSPSTCSGQCCRSTAPSPPRSTRETGGCSWEQHTRRLFRGACSARRPVLRVGLERTFNRRFGESGALCDQLLPIRAQPDVQPRADAALRRILRRSLYAPRDESAQCPHERVFGGRRR